MIGYSLNKDPSARIFVTMKNRVFQTGQRIEGAIHVNCIEDRPMYRSVWIRMKGLEKVSWYDGSKEKTDQKEIYDVAFRLHELADGLKKGHYSYPFSILLPSSLPSSLYTDDRNFIGYFIQGFLPTLGSSQVFRQAFHLRKPIKIPQQSIRGFETIATHCYCCCQSGSCDLSLESDVKYFQRKMVFSVKGKVDAGRSRAEVQSVRVKFGELLTKITDFPDDQVSHEWKEEQLYRSGEKVPNGKSFQFQTEVKLPDWGFKETVAGSISSRTYHLILETKFSCCHRNSRLELPGFMISHDDSQPPAIPLNQMEVKLPPEWMPSTFEKRVFENMPVCKHLPLLKILQTSGEEGSMNEEEGSIVDVEAEMGKNYM